MNVYGWSWFDLQNAAGMAARRTSAVMPYPDRFDSAWEGVVLHLTQNPDAEFGDLIRAGHMQVMADLNANLRHWGMQDNSRAYATFWTASLVAESPEHAIVLRTAIQQVSDVLPQHHMATLMVQATSLNQRDAAARTGCSVATFALHLIDARTTFTALWFDDETPPALSRSQFRHSAPAATHCKNGHEYTPENTRIRKGSATGKTKRACRACDRAAEKRRCRRKVG